jgi:hypothetical protein
MKYKTIFAFLVMLLFVNCVVTNGLKIKKIEFFYQVFS